MAWSAVCIAIYARDKSEPMQAKLQLPAGRAEAAIQRVALLQRSARPDARCASRALRCRALGARCDKASYPTLLHALAGGESHETLTEKVQFICGRVLLGIDVSGEEGEQPHIFSQEGGVAADAKSQGMLDGQSSTSCGTVDQSCTWNRSAPSVSCQLPSSCHQAVSAEVRRRYVEPRARASGACKAVRDNVAALEKAMAALLRCAVEGANKALAHHAAMLLRKPSAKLFHLVRPRPCYALLS